MAEQPANLGRILVYSGAPDVVEQTLFVIEAKQQMLYGLRATLSVEPAMTQSTLFQSLNFRIARSPDR